jgi:hypothetical protein
MLTSHPHAEKRLSIMNEEDDDDFTVGGGGGGDGGDERRISTQSISQV